MTEAIVDVIGWQDLNAQVTILEWFQTGECVLMRGSGVYVIPKGKIVYLKEVA